MYTNIFSPSYCVVSESIVSRTFYCEISRIFAVFLNGGNVSPKMAGTCLLRARVTSSSSFVQSEYRKKKRKLLFKDVENSKITLVGPSTTTSFIIIVCSRTMSGMNERLGGLGRPQHGTYGRIAYSAAAIESVHKKPSDEGDGFACVFRTYTWRDL